MKEIRNKQDVTISDLAQASWLVYLNNRASIFSYKKDHLNEYSFDEGVIRRKGASGCFYSILSKNFSDNKTPIIITFKGTDNFDDLIEDAKILRHGKALAYQEETDRIVAEAMKKYPGRPIILTGHSLGGSLANHAVAKVLNNSQTENTPDIRCVTFGAPGLDDETHKAIYEKGNAAHFITIENTHDPIAGSAGVRPTPVIYRMVEDRYANPLKPHGLDHYAGHNTAGTEVTDNKRIQGLSSVVVSGDLNTVHRALMNNELERLKQKKEPATPKLWFLQVALALTSANNQQLSAKQQHDFYSQAMTISDKHFFTPSSKLTLRVETNDTGVITNLKEITEYLDKQISRMQKDDRKYLKYTITREETLKLSLFKSLKQKLETESNTINPIELQKSLESISQMHRDENFQARNETWLERALSALYPGENNAFKQLSKDARHRWFGPPRFEAKSAANIPQIEEKNNKIENLNFIIYRLRNEIQRLEKNDNEYTKPSTAETLKLSLFRLLHEQLEKNPNQFTPIELQSTLNTIYKMERSEKKYAPVTIIQMGFAEANLQEKSRNVEAKKGPNFEFFWAHLIRPKEETTVVITPDTQKPH